MSNTLIVVAILLGLALMAALITEIVLLILKTVATVNGGSSLLTLCDRFPALAEPPDGLLRRQTVTIGAIVYKRCVTLGILTNGLYLARGSKRTLIPWHEVRHISYTTLYWQQIPLLIIGEPPIASIGIPAKLEKAVRRHLSSVHVAVNGAPPTLSTDAS